MVCQQWQHQGTNPRPLVHSYTRPAQYWVFLAHHLTVVYLNNLKMPWIRMNLCYLMISLTFVFALRNKGIITDITDFLTLWWLFSNRQLVLGAVITYWGQTSTALILKERHNHYYRHCNEYHACTTDYTEHHNVHINAPVFYKKQTSSGTVYIQLYCMHLKCVWLCVYNYMTGNFWGMLCFRVKNQRSPTGLI